MSIASKLNLPNQEAAAGGLFKGSFAGKARSVIKAVTDKLNALEISFTLLSAISFTSEAFGRQMSIYVFLTLLSVLIVIFTERIAEYRNKVKPE